MGFIITDKINQSFYHDEMHLFIIYAPLGYGKSAYSLKASFQIYKDWEKVKQFVVFHPEDFVNRCLTMSEKGEREKTIVWDDAGLWLFYLDYSNPFVQAVMKYLNVARTNWGSIIFTTPTPTYITNKLRNFPQNISIKIVKASSDQDHTSKPRIAKAYRSWVAPDFRHQGVHLVFADKFSALLPNDFYAWYKPLRDSYAREAGQLMFEELKKTKEKIKDATDNPKGFLENTHMLEQAIENTLSNT